jgi:hypothetical protein
VAIYFTQQHPPLPLSEWQQWTLRWLSFNNQSLKDFYAWPLVAGAAWTLLYEWGFYFSLPLLFLLAHPKQLSQWQNIAMLMISLPVLYYVFTLTTVKLYGLFLLAFFAVWLEDFFKNVFTITNDGNYWEIIYQDKLEFKVETTTKALELSHHFILESAFLASLSCLGSMVIPSRSMRSMAAVRASLFLSVSACVMMPSTSLQYLSHTKYLLPFWMTSSRTRLSLASSMAF